MLQKRLSALCAFIAIAIAACGGTTSNAVYPGVPVNSGPSSIGNYALVGPSDSKISLSISTVAAQGTPKPYITVTASASAPSNATTLQSTQRRATPQSQLTPQSTGDNSILYLQVSSNIAANASQIAGLGVVLSSAPPSGPIYLAYYDGSQWVTIGSAASVSGDQITFGSITLSPNLPLPLDLVVYTGSILTTPSPEPPAPVASPSAETIYISTTGTVDVTTGPDTTITATSSNTTEATVTSSVTATDAGVAAFTVTAGAASGTATITFTDPLGRTTSTAITVTNAPPTPLPSPAAITISAGDTSNIVVTAQPSDLITATSSNTAVATVTSSVTTSSNGQATFTVTAVTGGVATISFTDTHSQTGTLAVTVSNVKNGSFSQGTADWAPCSYTHTGLASPINPSTPDPYGTAVPSPQPTGTWTPVPAASLAPVLVVSPPPNDNPTPAAVSTSPPPQVSNSVALVGSIDAGVIPLPAGETGICQTVAVPAGADQLSFWVFEGGEYYAFKDNDQEALVLDSSGTTIEDSLFVENNCYVHPAAGYEPLYTSTSSGCWPEAYGGDSYGDYNWVGGGYWQPRGPYDLSAYDGQTVTLYFGVWLSSSDAGATYGTGKYGQFMYVGGVQMTGSSTLPTTGPAAKHRMYSMSIRR